MSDQTTRPNPNIINAPKVTQRKISTEFRIGYLAPEERKNYSTEFCWYCGKSRQCLPPKGCTLTHKDDPLKDAVYPKQDPYKLMRNKDGKIERLRPNGDHYDF